MYVVRSTEDVQSTQTMKSLPSFVPEDGLKMIDHTGGLFFKKNLFCASLSDILPDYLMIQSSCFGVDDVNGRARGG